MKDNKAFADKITPVLLELESALWEQDYYTDELNLDQPHYSAKALRAACKIFMSVLMDKMYSKLKKEDRNLVEQVAMVEAVGASLHALVLDSTGIDLKQMYKEEE